jgi:hypothetical protein
LSHRECEAIFYETKKEETPVDGVSSFI